MKKIILLTFILSIVNFTAPQAQEKEDSTLPKAPFVKAQTIKEWEKRGREFQFVDVREPDEFDAGHLPTAINIPYYDLEKRVEELPKEKPVVIYCTASSWRAPYSANLLADKGLSNVFVLDGGASHWNAGGQMIMATNQSQKAKIVPKPKDLKRDLKRPVTRKYKTSINLTKEQLKEFDGKMGRPAYVAYKGKIYDLTQSRLWRGGEHDPSEGQAYAGYDLTEAMDLSPHGDKYLKDFPVVGELLD